MNTPAATDGDSYHAAILLMGISGFVPCRPLTRPYLARYIYYCIAVDYQTFPASRAVAG
jgi:hypothetical protein